MPRHQVSGELDSLKSDVAQLRADLAGLADALLRAGREEVSDTKERISQAAEKRVDDLRSAVNSAKEAGRSALDSLEEQIGERPITSLLVAFAAGLAIAKIVERR